MPETKHFVNDGYGWACKRCLSSDDENASRRSSDDDASRGASHAADADAQRIASNNADTLRDSAKDEDAQHGASASSRADALARFFREGEAEERDPRLSARSLARWTDASRRTLRCPRCGVEEEINAGSP